MLRNAIKKQLVLNKNINILIMEWEIFTEKEIS